MKVDLDALFDQINDEFATTKTYREAGAHLEQAQEESRLIRVEAEKQRQEESVREGRESIADIISLFVKGHMGYRSSSVSSTIDLASRPVLYSYETPIAFRTGYKEIAYNPNKYSPTTSRHQSFLRSAMEKAGYRPHEETYTPLKMGKYEPASQEPFVVWKMATYDLTREQEQELLDKHERARKYKVDEQEELLSLRQEDAGYAQILGKTRKIEAIQQRMDKIIKMIAGEMPYDMGV